MPTISRNKQNYCVMVAIYNVLADFNYANKEFSRNTDELLSGICECEIFEIPHYVKDLTNLSLLHYGEAVKAFSVHLNEWKWERIPLMSQAILIMSYVHYYKLETINRLIVIDVAVELAKTYIEEKQAKFINAILDKVLK